MKTQEIRQKFLNYFRQQQHAIVASSPVVPHDDPTLLFTNAGMNQFKDVFLGKSQREYSKAATSQKCIRAGGKHNDLDNVGHTKRHLTFFEMLGNFSFGDYFKKEAIRFAWEVSTEILQFDSSKIWATVFEEDDEAFELWTPYLPTERIIRLGEKTNFWAMGDTGPCGPCSELLYDLGPAYGDASSPLTDSTEERYLEFWNLVFMQFNRQPEGTVIPLPKPSIDTGMGLERAVELASKVGSVFETDVLRHIIGGVEKLTDLRYDPKNLQTAPSFHVIADHLRSLSFAIADGAQPSNVDRGYVLRKILRRAVRYGRNLGFNAPFLANLLPNLIETMGQDYPELKQSEERIGETLTAEEESFFRTLKRGGNILNQIVERSKENKLITGDDAFKLKDTYGLPLEEITLLAHDANLRVDLDRFNTLEQEAKERSRQVHKTVQHTVGENIFAQYESRQAHSLFKGYEVKMTSSKVLGIMINNDFADEVHQGQEAALILDQTPFYAEKGGQIGDTGVIKNESTLFSVKNCQQPYQGVVSHIGTVERGVIRIGDTLTAEVDIIRREKTEKNHTATHLLHWALRTVLGNHIRQAGSVVEPHRLRFDFSHHKPLTQEEIRQIEDLINTRIRGNLPVKTYELSYDEVQKRSDIIQFFDEKYGSIVRVVDINFSKELCGGTHTSQVGNIGLFRIASEGSIAAGIRRIIAVTGEEAESLARESEVTLQTVADLLKTQPTKIVERASKLLEENRALSQELKELHQNQIRKLLEEALCQIDEKHPFLVLEVPLKPAELREFADKIMERIPSVAVVLGSREKEKCGLVIAVSDDLVEKGIHANALIKEIAPLIGGGGGGKANFAQAGGTQVDQLDKALFNAKERLLSLKH